MTWAVVLVTAAGCYLFKLAGLSLPRSLLSSPRVQRVAALLPVALLAALVGVQTFATGRSLVLDARAVGLLAAAVALAVRAPFLVVVVAAAAAAALVRALA